jgi:putative ABC transport system permease protein
MSIGRQLAAGLCRLINPISKDKEIADEVRQYFDEATAERIARGVPLEEARRAVALESGNMMLVQEQVRSYGWENVLLTLFADLRFALRQVVRNPGFAIVTTLTLALGIGAAIAIFSVVKAVILNPLPFRQPDRLVHLWEGSGDERYHLGDEAYFSTVRPGSYFDWMEGSQSFESMSAYRRQSMLIAAGDRSELISTEEVYPDFFETLGTPALIGRTLRANDYEQGPAQVAVVSYSLWKQRYGGDPGLVGRRISLNRQSYEVVGVMPAGFLTTDARYAALWTPHWINPGERADRLTWGLFPIARLRNSISWEQAQNELFVLSARISADHPTAEKVHAIVVPMKAQLIGTSWKLLLLLSCGVALLLTIACVNVANLLLARVVDREGEFAIRAALGASRRRLVIQLLVEGLVFAGMATVVGLGLTFASIRGLTALLPQSANLPRLDTIRIDLGTLGFICALTLAIGLFFSSIPLLRVLRGAPSRRARMEGRTVSADKGRRRLGQLFILSEFVFSLVLLTLGVLLVESFLKLQHVDPGFDTSRLLVFRVPVPDANYGTYTYGGKSPARERLYERLEQAVNVVPGVESVGLTAGLPLREEFNPWGVIIDGHVLPASGSEGETDIQMVNPAFSRTLRLRLIAGRFLNDQDSQDAPPAAVINESFARAFMSHENPIGKRATVWFAKTIIVGVVADFKLNGLDRRPYPEIFWSIRQAPPPNVWVMVRTTSDTASAASAIRQAIGSLDRELPVTEMQAMPDVVSDSLWLKRTSAELMGLVAGLALLLAAAGIYSVMSYSAARRKKEVAVRMAFGATRGHIFRLILGETCRLALLGCLLGCFAAFFACKAAMSISYLSPGLSTSQSHEPLHPGAFILSSLFLFLVAIVAAYTPARRALRVDPSETLRAE